MTIQEQLRALWREIDSAGGRTDTDFDRGFCAAINAVTAKLEAIGFDDRSSTAADEIDRLRAGLGKIAAGDGVYGAQAREYKQIARDTLAGPSAPSADDLARGHVEHQRAVA